jgi:CDP-glycerol glycerophosphotransferase (TagB/SpsB family)
MPTWRKGLLPDNFVNGQRAYYSDFKKTDFYQFYNSILTDEKISKALRDFDYKIIFLLHPGLITQLEDFTSSNKRIKILHPPYNFTEIINKTKVFVTDYSSVFYDFAYAGSSVIYSQFDRGIFFTRQKYKESFWTYSDNGFGPITETLDETCKKIIKFAKHGGKPDSKYKKRYSSAFPFSDKGFCERVIEATNLLDD